jgi:hypothetical protein
VKIRSRTGGSSISVNPRGNGGITISQGPGYVMLTEEEWYAVASAVAHLLYRPTHLEDLNDF